jgi:hypothetical protein
MLEGVVSTELDTECELEHCRPDMGARILLLFIGGIGIGVIIASLGLGYLAT